MSVIWDHTVGAWVDEPVMPVTMEPSTFEPDAPAPDADVTARFRLIRENVGGDMERALTLIDVGNLRAHAYRSALNTARDRESTLASAVSLRDTLIDSRDETIARLTSELSTARYAPITLDDPRLEAEWKRAGDIATDEGFCSEYDRMCARLGIPGREREYRVPVTVTVTFNRYVTARDADDAESTATDDLDWSEVRNISAWDVVIDDVTAEGAEPND